MNTDTPLNKVSGVHYWDRFLAERSDPVNLFRSCLDPEQQRELLRHYVCIVNIETSTFCNRKCVYCPLSRFDRTEQKRMSDDVFDAIIRGLGGVAYSSTVSLSLYNEPLADEGFAQRIALARSALPGAFIKFNSKGDYLTRALLDRLAGAGANAIFVTLHPAANAPYEDGDRRLQIQAFLSRLGLEGGIDQMLPRQHIESNVFYQGMRVRVMADNWEAAGNNRAGTLEFLSAREPRTSPCVRPFRELTISYDGYVYPCCQFFPDSPSSIPHRAGRVETEEDVFRLYASSRLAGYRRNLFCFGPKQLPCDRCADPDAAMEETKEARERLLVRASGR